MPTIDVLGAYAVEQDLLNMPSQVQRAIKNAMNRGIKSGRTVMVREMARNTGLKQKDIRDELTLREASVENLEARLGAKMQRIPLIKFGARGPEPSRGRGRGVTYRLPGGKGRAESGFIATMRSGHRGVFKRKGKARLGITELKGPSLGQVFSKFRVMALQRAYEVFEKEFDHELEFATTGAGSDGSD